MSKNFEILMVTVDWHSRNKVKSVKKGERYLKPSSFSGNHYEYDIVMYEKKDGDFYQVCIQTKGTPYLKTAGKYLQQNKLFKLENDLWIIKGDWKKNYKGIGYHACPTINTKGILEIGISFDGSNIQQSVTVDVNINIEGFDFEELKRDFEGEFWKLLTSDSSKLAITKEETINEKVSFVEKIEKIKSFLNYFDKIAAHPKRDLKHTTKTLPIKKVRPTLETYKKIAQRGLIQKLPSKAFEENYDIYENRFVCFMLRNIGQIAKNNIAFAQNQEKSLGSRIENNDKNIEYFENLLKPKKAEPLNVKTETLKKNEKIIIIEAHPKVANYYLCHFNGEDCWAKFSNPIFLKKDTLYHIKCSFGRTNNLIVTGKNKVYRYNIWKVDEIHEIRHIEQTQTLTVKDKKERDNQIATLKNKKQQDIDEKIKIEQHSKDYENIRKEIETRMKGTFYRKIKAKKALSYKPSMTFIQNLHYRNAYKTYQDILNSERIDVKTNNLFEQLSNYGIREMPIVYELWTLISTLSILSNSFHLKYQADDIKRLLKTITPNSQKLDKHIEIAFENEINDRKVTLHYQKKLANNKRPDILLEIATKTKTIFVVLDAKFKNYNYKASAIYEVKAMQEKYASTDNNYVFILHPCNNLSTVKLTNLGGDYIHLENENKTYPFHKYGYLKVKPLETDNLKKVIGMALEYLVECNHNAMKGNIKDPKPEHKMLCLSCGNTEMKGGEKIRQGYTGYKYTYICNRAKCEHKVYVNYCWNCQTKLYKHGRYWDYHKTSAENVFDIHCPNCGKTFAENYKKR